MSTPPVKVQHADAGQADAPSEGRPRDTDEMLGALLEGIAGSTGPECFKDIVRMLARALGVRYAIVAEFLPENASARSLAFWNGGEFGPAIDWALAGTPCEAVIGGAMCHHASGLREAFPEDRALVEMHAESYLGVPLRGAGGEVLGHLFVMDTRPMPETPRAMALFRIFAARAASELSRLRLERSLAASEERFRDLFDEAPIAYVLERLDTRFVRANRAARRAFGITEAEVEGTYGTSFVVNNPENHRRLKDAFESVGRGTDTSGVVLELKRRDTGAPLWIQWWSKPEPGGQLTRTMFIDITEKVMLEQERARLAAQNTLLREEIRTAHGEIVGRSPSVARVLERVDRVAPTDATVLIQGETGTGKELVARAIHEGSTRRTAPFVKVNCAALPAGLVESEFFGHEKGAFTGAVSSRRGRFELADGGTIFLDEVGEVSPEVQVKLLRVLQESEFERVGGTQTIRVNVRVIAATNRNLRADVEAGRFRADMFYRLGVFPIDVPPLRDRRSDIPLLASFFVTQLSASIGRRIDAIEPETMERLARHAWPGNIRELRNTIERAIVLATGPVLKVPASELAGAEDPPDGRGSGEAKAGGSGGGESGGVGVSGAAPPARTLEEVEREHICRVLERTGGAIAGPKGAAVILGVPPSTLRSRMAKLGIKG